MPETGHLFVVHADMQKLAADAYVIPWDGEHVSNAWKSMIASQGDVAGFDRFTPALKEPGEGLTRVVEANPSADEGRSVGGVCMLVDSVRGIEQPEDLGVRISEAIGAAAKGLTPHGERHRPLIAVPLMGVGQGNFPGRRLSVVAVTARALSELVQKAPVDIAFVLRHPADYAAAQWQRRQIETEDGSATPGNGLWGELTDAQVTSADRLGKRAAANDLSVFVGAGVSRPLGLPGWGQLLERLSTDAKRGWLNPAQETYPALAEELAQELGEAFNQRIAELCQTSHYALGHALLAGLRCHSVATTNYDQALELAAASVHGPGREPRVMARQLANGGLPWVLKLHGDTAAPETIVLSKSQYESLKNDRGALRGVVQTLMLTSHLLFVGFGFADSDFLAMAQAVAKARALASDGGDQHVGTALALMKAPTKRYKELSYETFKGDMPVAARIMEIFLDRVAWTCQVEGDRRAAFELHPDYQEDRDDKHQKAFQALQDLRAAVDDMPDSALPSAVDDLLIRLGVPNLEASDIGRG